MKQDLEKRIAELSLEIRNYPTPIARCDEQLTKLLEQRFSLMEKKRILEEQGSCSPEALRVNDGGFDAA